MKINSFFWEKITESERLKILRRSEHEISALVSSVRPILDGVRERGDKAVVEYTKKFDGVQLRKNDIRVKQYEFKEARKKVNKAIHNALKQAIDNIERYHRQQMPSGFWMIQIQEGVFAGEKVTPVGCCGLYVPRGKGSFPSVMMMLGVPARIAGVERVIACTPPGKNGEIDAATLLAAEMCGIKEVYRVGGAQAIAAMAFGTETIPRVDKIVGPGSGYVAAAKRELYGIVDVGLPAGPSESIILADENTDPKIAAADLLIEAEHGADSCALLVTHSPRLAERVKTKLPTLLKRLPAVRRGFCEKVLSRYGGIIITKDLEQSIEVVNRFAPEHLEILTIKPFEALEKIKNAGEILVGAHTPITMGNFCVGVNAILPTGGFARSYSGVSVLDFLKRSSISYLTDTGFDALKTTACTLAKNEGFPAHELAVHIRSRKKRKRT